MSWLRVTWTEASQVLALTIDPPADPAPAGMVPEDYFNTQLLGKGQFDHAVNFLGAALPRLEAVQWATATLERDDAQSLPPHRKAMREAVRGWLRDPCDPRRRAAWALASDDEAGSPEKLLASAVYFSGGSIAPEDCDPVLPEPHLCGRLAATAILARAYGETDTEAVLRFAVTEGDRIASS